MMETARLLLLLDKIDDDQRDAIHEVVKEHSNFGWWHHHANTWIVSGGTVGVWRNRIKPLIKGGPSSALVMKLPAASEDREWSYFGPDSKGRCKWLHESCKRYDT